MSIRTKLFFVETQIWCCCQFRSRSLNVSHSLTNLLFFQPFLFLYKHFTPPISQRTGIIFFFFKHIRGSWMFFFALLASVQWCGSDNIPHEKKKRRRRDMCAICFGFNTLIKIQFEASKNIKTSS